ncbi:TrkH family potassium uptake protein [Mariniphaga sp.]|uniref:TrkH family potassium uptake protein n=1 Tax=Mariniphaga sp. TaxID=1954475 RepID=UPI0035674478
MKINLKIFTRIKRLPILISTFGLLTIIYDLGFKRHPDESQFLQYFYLFSILVGAVSITERYFFEKTRPALKIVAFDVFLVLLSAFLLLKHFGIAENLAPSFLSNTGWLRLTVVFIFLREFIALKVNFKWALVNPAQLFILSFLALIISGCFFLLLPNATHSGISLIDALFTATSAVCVTGLIVVDTGSYFTFFGQIVIITLVQAGGLGIMTFASYFGYFFKGSSSYKKQLVLNELTWSGKLGEVFTTLKRIIIITVFIEVVGAIFIFWSLNNEVFPVHSERLFFSIFHSISGYCNAGFSTLQESLYSIEFRFNYSLHLIIAFLFILGGLGFPIVFNLLKYFKNKLINGVLQLFGKKHSHLPWIININTRIVLMTTLILISVGTIHFFIFEYNNTLAEHNLWGKIVGAFFGSVTPRTAGFNTTDTASLSIPVVLMLFFLMWVGASPASTGGGIKTSTLALAVLNFLSVARGKKRLEVFGREISQTSVNRAFSVVFLSVIAISLSVFGVLWFDKEKDVLDVAFECVSAFSTVGLSRGITADLSSYSKFILILTMFVGRVGMLTVLIALFKKVTRYKYRYPAEDVLIH